MKKILVVDDTPANLDAAKAFFANNTDFEFIYATNRKEAEELLPSCDGLITDGQMPFDEHTPYISNERSLGLNGKLLFLEAQEVNKPVIFISSHGGALVLQWSAGPKKEDWVSQNKEYEAKKGLTIENIIADLKGKDFTPEFLESGPTSFIAWKLNEYPIQTLKDTNKESDVGWELAFKKLSEEFKLNEKPTEIQKIKLQ